MGMRRLGSAVIAAVASWCAAVIVFVPMADAAPAATPHLDAVQAALKAKAPGFAGVLWNRTATNSVAGDLGSGAWVLQTPDCWGQVACATPAGIERFLHALHDDLSAAEHIVDITTLDPMPSGTFLDTIISGLHDGYLAGRRPLVRVLDGKPPFISLFYPNAWRTRDSLTAGIGP